MTRHLTPDTFVNLLDGTVDEATVPHLAACGACRRQFAELRRTWDVATAAEMPEPSPLFWDHLSARVREAVAAEPEGPAGWWRWASPWHVAGVGTLATATLIVAVMVVAPARRTASVASPVPVVLPAIAAQAVSGSRVVWSEDPSLSFVADLAADLEWDDVSVLGLAPRDGADRAIADLTDGERTELQRLLNEALHGA